jgi:FkbM family methyltransferase
MRATLAYRDAPIATAARLAYWTIAECVSNRLRFRVGPFQFLTIPNNTCGLLSYVDQSYEPDELRIVDLYLRPGDTFVDAGANVGIFTAYASRAVGKSGCVIAFEAHPLISTVLAENVALNKLTNVTVVTAALGDKAGELKMKYPRADPGSTHVAIRPSAEDATVPVVTLDAALRERGVAHADYLKIDVEGFERQVLEGAMDTITRNPTIIVQTEVFEEHLARYGQKPADLFAFLAGLGFVPHVINTDGELSQVHIPQRGNVIWRRQVFTHSGNRSTRTVRSLSSAFSCG